MMFAGMGDFNRERKLSINFGGFYPQGSNMPQSPALSFSPMIGSH